MKYLLTIMFLSVILYAQNEDYYTNRTERKFYISGIAQYGPGNQKIKAGQEYDPYAREYNKIYIRPGGGYGVEGSLGTDITNYLSLEIGLGVLRSGKVVHTEHIVFDKSVIRLSLLYKYKLFRYHTIYLGSGITVVQDPRLQIEQADEVFKASYSQPKGYNLIAGLQFNYTKNLYFFSDVKYNNLGKFEIMDASYSGDSVVFDEIESKYHEFNADGTQFRIGVGYYIK